MGMQKAAMGCFKRSYALDSERVSSLVNIAALQWQVINPLQDYRDFLKYKAFILYYII
jgi:hypothetical protein